MAKIIQFPLKKKEVLEADTKHIDDMTRWKNQVAQETERLMRVRASLARIDQLMHEIKAMQKKEL